MVSNWSSGDLSIVSIEQNKEIKRLKMGAFPRGIVIDSKSEYAYITIMGRKEVVKLSLLTFKSQKIKVGKGPRHLCISPKDKFLYITLNSENKIAKLNLETLEIKKVKAGHQPRSMAIDAHGKYLYVVNYNDHNFTKYDAHSLTTMAITKTKSKPIGITYDNLLNNVWVSCYSGYIQIFKDSLVVTSKSNKSHQNQIKKEVQDSLSLSFNKSEKRKEVAEVDVSFKDRSRYRKKEKKSEIVSTSGDTYLIVTGAFSKLTNVNQRVKELQVLGYESQTYFDKGKNLTFVIVAQFKTKKQALASSIRTDLEEKGISTTLKYEKNKLNLTNVKKVPNFQIDDLKEIANKNKVKQSHLGNYYIGTGVFSKSLSITNRTQQLIKIGIEPFYSIKNSLTYIYAGQFKTKELALESDVVKLLKENEINFSLIYNPNLNVFMEVE